MGQVINPRVYAVRDYAVRWILLHEVLNGFTKEHCPVVYLAGGVTVGGGGHRLNAIREANLLGGEVDDVKAEEEGIDT